MVANKSFISNVMVIHPSAAIHTTLYSQAKGDYRVLRSLLKREEGQGLVEYGLIIFLVAIVVIAVLVLVGPRIGDMFSSITAAI